ncbi:unnamed protein product, partial [Symbiodinium sp. KB8]
MNGIGFRRDGSVCQALKAVDIFLRQRQKSDRGLFNLSSQVQRQQKEAASLRKEIAVVEPDLEHHEQELKTVQQATETLRKLQKTVESLVARQQQHCPLSGMFYGRDPGAEALAARIAQHREEIRIREQVLNEHLPLAELKSIVQTLQSKLKRLRQQLKKAETPPASVFQPLPERDGMAFAVLFFLYTPELLRSLSRATILAQ